MNNSKNVVGEKFKSRETPDSRNLAMFVLSTLINSENSYSSDEVVLAVVNDPDFLIRTIEHISRVNCINELAKKIDPKISRDEDIYQLPDDSKHKTSAEKSA